MTPAGASYRQTGDLLEIAFNRPERRNALGAAEWAVLDEAIARAETDAACEFVVIRGEGKLFCAGVDIDQIGSAQQSGGLLRLIESNSASLRRLEALPQIVIVAMNGPAVGIGAHLALCADIVLATDEAYLWIPEARLGIPDVLHYRMLEGRLGRAAALSMLLLGEKLAMREATAAGIVAATCPDGDALNAAALDRLTRLRSVARPVRAAFKSYTRSRGDRADFGGQFAAVSAALAAGLAS